MKKMYPYILATLLVLILIGFLGVYTLDTHWQYKKDRGEIILTCLEYRGEWSNFNEKLRQDRLSECLGFFDASNNQ